MEIMKKSILLIGAFALMVFFSACNTPDEEVATNAASEELTIAEIETSALKSTESVDEDVEAACHAVELAGGHVGRYILPKRILGGHFPECASVTIQNDSFPKVITIEYGEDCVTRRGLEKTGTIIMTLSDSLKTPGSTYTVEYIDLKVGVKTMDKVSVRTYHGLNENGNHLVTVEENSLTNFNDSVIVVRESEKAKEWLDGFDTPKIDDDKMFVTGSSKVTINDTISYSKEIIDPLYIDRACRFILSGVIEIVKDGETMVIDYGEGACDNIAVVTKDGESEEIELTTSRFKKKDFNRKSKNMSKRKGWW